MADFWGEAACAGLDELVWALPPGRASSALDLRRAGHGGPHPAAVVDGVVALVAEAT
jgi:hypothetical protein